VDGADFKSPTVRDKKIIKSSKLTERKKGGKRARIGDAAGDGRRKGGEGWGGPSIWPCEREGSKKKNSRGNQSGFSSTQVPLGKAASVYDSEARKKRGI